MNKEESTKFAVKMVKDMISFFEVNPEITSHIEDEVLNIDIESTELNSLLIGRNAENIRAFQSVVSSALRSQDADIYRISIDIADYKKQHAEKIADKTRGWIEHVIETGEEKRVHLNAADRRTVHQTALEFSEIKTHSEGQGRDRELIISRV